MGRYYEGDIEGKFWFGVQSSDDGEFFGAQEQESSLIDYVVPNDDLDIVKEGIEVCKKKLRVCNALTLYTENSCSFGASINWDYLTNTEQRYYAGWMARLEMGIKILIFFNESPEDSCYFTAET